MFKKKQDISPMNYWDKQYKEMHQIQILRQKKIEQLMQNIKVYEGMKHYLPSAENALLDKSIQECKVMIHNTLAAYDDTNREMRAMYDKLDYCKNWIAIKPSIKMAEDAYRHMMELYHK